MPAAKVILKPAEVHALIGELAVAMAREVKSLGGEWAIVGIRTGGEVLAQLLANELAQCGIDLPVGVLDITFYRDDLGRRTAGAAPQPVVRKTEIDFQIDGRSIFLVDDVLYTGRTVRAALNELMDFGRPAQIRLAVLIDRSGRELPIQADLAGKRVEVPPGLRVQAHFDGPGEPQVTMEPTRNPKP